MGEFFIFSFFLGTFFFLFPIFVNTDIYVDVRENKAWFSLGLYRLRIFGGYAQIKQGGIVIHLTKKKAVFLPFAQMGNARKKFEITDGFQLYTFRVTVETGGAQSPAGILIASALQSFGGAVFSILKTKYPFVSLKNGTLLSDKPCLKVSFRAVTVFNGLVLAMAFSKKILEAIINWIRKRKLTTSWKKRQSV